MATVDGCVQDNIPGHDDDNEFVMISDLTELPSTYSELKAKMASWETSSWILGDQPDVGELSEETRSIAKYCAPGLKIGRLLNKTMVVVCGQTGLGVSSTIRTLFHNNSNSGSDLTEFTETVQFDGIQTELVVVQLPGALYPENEVEIRNLATIKTYREQQMSLEPLGMMDLWANQFVGMKVREKVYPNLVLFITSCRDERMEGAASNLRKRLKLLRAYDVVDTSHPNLLVIATHAAHVPRNSYLERANQITSIVRRAVFDIFGVSLGMVHLIENATAAAPEEAATQLASVQQDMTRITRANSDVLGEQTIREFYRKNINQSPFRTCVPWTDEPSEESLAAAQQLLCQKEILTMDDETPFYQFSHLGHGYNEATLDVRAAGIVQLEGTRPGSVSGKKWNLPANVSVINMHSQGLSDQIRFFRDPLEQKTATGTTPRNSTQMVARWTPSGLGSRTLGRMSHFISWLGFNRRNQNSGESYAYLFEICTSRAQIEGAEDHLTPEFREELSGLNSWGKYFFRTWNCSDFFSKWGTSLVYQESVGAFIHIVCTTTKNGSGNSSLSQDEQHAQFERKVKHHFEMLRATMATLNQNAETEGEYREDWNGIVIEEIILSGRNRPPLRSLSDLTRDMYRDWINEASEQPMTLSVQPDDLIPFYDLLQGQEAVTISESTRMYLQNGYSYTAYCFPASTLVLTRTGAHVRIPDLQTTKYEELVTLDQSSTPTTTSTCSFLHFDPNIVTAFIQLICDNGAMIRLSSQHLIFISTGQSGQFQTVPAESVVVGDSLVYYTRTEGTNFPRVVDVQEVMDIGVFAPLTQSGTFIANRFLVSCYAHVTSHTVAHIALKPLRLWHQIKMLSEQRQNSHQSTGIHRYAHILFAVWYYVQKWRNISSLCWSAE